MYSEKRGKFAFLTNSERQNAGVSPGGAWLKKKTHAKAYANKVYGERVGFVQLGNVQNRDRDIVMGCMQAVTIFSHVYRLRMS